ncbi:MAG: hypothetical protein HY318_11890 [Armatimonadetes bacterium]|nr:hypothetical protein [Armatimonadota bacterium]
MNLLATLEPCLQALSQHCDILPAVGGAMEQMLQPDEEERDDEEITGGEGVVTQYAESPPPGTFETPIPCPSIGRTEQHRFRFFLDGAIRSYFLCTALERQRAVPVTMSQIGAALLHHRDDGRLDVHDVAPEILFLLVAEGRSRGEVARFTAAWLCLASRGWSIFQDKKNLCPVL